MNGNIKLSANLLIGLAKVMARRGGQRFAIIGKSGGGKTNTLKVFAEQWLKNGWPLVVIDPMNNFRSLRDSGLPLIVAGMRKSADVQFTPHNAGLLARFSFNERVSVVLDTSFHEPEAGIEALQQFLETLWRLILQQDEDAPHLPLAVLIDEAHLFIPQNGKTDVSDLLIDMSKRGRQLNLSMAFTTQRPASIQKEFLLMSNVLVAHKVSFGDVGVVADAFSQPRTHIRSAMKALVAGQALVSGDADLVDLNGEDFILAQIDEWNAAQGERFLAVMKGEEALRPIDPASIEALRKSMQSKHHVETFVSAEEAQKLRERIAELEAQVERLKAGQSVDIPVKVDYALEPGTIQVVYPAIPGGQPKLQAVMHNVGLPEPQTIVRPRAELPEPEPTNGSIEPLSSGARKVLTKLAAIYPMRVTRKQLATLTDYTDGGGAFKAIWSALKLNQLISDLADHVEITGAGFRYLGRQPRNVPLTHGELMQMWREVLPERTFEVLTIVVRQYPRAISIDDLALVVGMTAGGGGFNSHIGKLRLNNLIVRERPSGGLRANSESLKLGM